MHNTYSGMEGNKSLDTETYTCSVFDHNLKLQRKDPRGSIRIKSQRQITGK